MASLSTAHRARRVTIHSASATRRLLAGGVDLLPVVLVTAALWWLDVGRPSALVPADGLAFLPEHLAELWLRTPHVFARPLFVPAFVAAFYQAATSVLLDESPGKRLLRLTIVGPDGHTASPLRRLVRSALMLVSAATLGLGWMVAAIIPSRRSLHDVLSETWVHSEP